MVSKNSGGGGKWALIGWMGFLGAAPKLYNCLGTSRECT